MVIQGLIRPPPEIRAVADRTALYVAKNGRAFESRILNSAKGKTPKFAFLHGTSPFHAYYEDRIQFYENGGEDEKEDDKKKDGETTDQKEATSKEKQAAEAARKREAKQKASVTDPVAKALLTQRSKIAQLRRAAQEEASKDSESKNEGDDNDESKPRAAVSIPAPPPFVFVNIVAPSSLTLTQIETIQTVAQFAALAGKGSPVLQQLSLREWRNPAFSFLQPRHGHFAYFSALVDAYRRCLDSINGSSSSGDGVVKEMANNPNKCLELAAYRAEYERDLEEQAKKDDTAVVQIDWHDFVVVETIDFPAGEVVELSMLPPPPPPPVPSAAATAGDTIVESDEEEPIRVVPSYTPKVVAQTSNSLEKVIDPITGKSIPVKDMPEHMRIQLLDPKWAEERKKFQEKQKDSNLVSGDVIASNIARFTQARGDVFGKTEQSLLSKESDSKKRLEEANRIIRESQQSAVGPSLPQQRPSEPVRQAAVHPPPHMDPRLQPETKRPKVDVAAPPPPPPPPPGFEGSAPTAAMPQEPFAATVPLEKAPQELMSESAFAESLPKPEVTLQIRIPNDPAQMAWNFYGQIVPLTVNVMSKIKAIKQELSKTHLNGMPANKIQLKSTATNAFLKDNTSLAALNIGPTATLELVPRARGGRK